ncbi:MAG TPA: M48 family metallopeptidase [Solirubrobacteraceae bacterium]|jgi:Zn-dependent protease with chaperone function|nr:M48 family metallopeptidase [Solirubrobacteraceae bacterium]
MALPAEGYQLKDISPRAFQHPADRAATGALAAIPFLDTIVRKLIELGYERALRQSFLGASVRLSEDQLPEVHTRHRRAYLTLDVPEVPDLYLTQVPFANAMTIGAGHPIVVVQSELIRLLDPEAQRAVFAHEAGHVLSDHVLYRTALEIMLKLGGSARLPLAVLPVRSALLEWFRASEFSCDRAAAVATRDPLTVCRSLMVITAGAEAEKLNLDAFMAQGNEYREQGGAVERLSRLLIDLNLTHAVPVRRAGELMQWVRSGEYDRIVGGEYPKRDDPVDPRADAADAAQHYAERVRSRFEEVGESMADAGRQVSDWLSRLGR